MSVGVTLRDSTSDVDPQGLPLGTTTNPLKVTAVSSTGGEASVASVVSAANSTETPLGVSAVFTGTSVDALQYGTIIVSVFSDVASATNGLSIQQSKNATNWDVTDTYTISAGASSKISVPRQEQYVRVVYTNGGTGQAAFRLSTILDPRMPRSSSIKPADGLNAENDMDAAISVQTTFNGTSLDLQRSVINSLNSTGTGIAAVGIVGQFDDVSTSAVTENQHATVRLSSDRSLLVTTQNTLTRISTATTTLVKSGAGTLKSVTINSKGTVASTITIYDSLTATGTILGILDSLNLGGTFTYDGKFSTGLTLVTTGTVAPDVTVSWK